MFSKRYHLFTLTAVFFALGTGILLGGTHGEKWLESGQEALVRRLEKRITDTSREIRLLTGRAELREREMGARDREHRELFQNVLRDQLKDKLVLVVGGSPQESERLTQAIAWAGGVTAQAPSHLRFYDRYDVVMCLTDPRTRRFRSGFLRDIRLAYSGPMILQNRRGDLRDTGGKRALTFTFRGKIPREDSLGAYQAVRLIREAMDREKGVDEGDKTVGNGHHPRL